MAQLRTEPKKGAAPAASATPSKDGSISAFGPARSTVTGSPLRPDELRKLDTFWRACNYLALGMTYLKANPLLKEPPAGHQGPATSATGGQSGPGLRYTT